MTGGDLLLVIGIAVGALALIFVSTLFGTCTRCGTPTFGIWPYKCRYCRKKVGR